MERIDPAVHLRLHVLANMQPARGLLDGIRLISHQQCLAGRVESCRSEALLRFFSPDGQALANIDWRRRRLEWSGRMNVVIARAAEIKPLPALGLHHRPSPE
jgi:hypothetical protein